MTGAQKADTIICSNGHVGGKLERDIGDNETVDPKDSMPQKSTCLTGIIALTVTNG